MRRQLSGALICAWLAGAMPAPARSATPGLGDGAPAMAEERYRIGRRLYRQGDFRGAANEFRTALEVHPSSGRLAFNYARAIERAGDLQAAIAGYGRYLELVPDAPERGDVEALIGSLSARVREQQPELVVASRPAGAAVILDDGLEPVEGLTPTRLRAAPGSHVVRLRLHGHAEAFREVTAAVGRVSSVFVELEPLPASVTPPPAAATDGASPWPQWALAGAGVAGVIGGAVLLGVAEARVGEVEDLGPSRADLARREDAIDDVASARLYGGLSLGLGLALAGASWWLWRGPEQDAVAVGWGTPRLGLRSGPLGWGGRF